jgi:hypothetical protein
LNWEGVVLRVIVLLNKVQDEVTVTYEAETEDSSDIPKEKFVSLEEKVSKGEEIKKKNREQNKKKVLCRLEIESILFRQVILM